MMAEESSLELTKEKKSKLLWQYFQHPYVVDDGESDASNQHSAFQHLPPLLHLFILQN